VTIFFSICEIRDSSIRERFAENSPYRGTMFANLGFWDPESPPIVARLYPAVHFCTEYSEVGSRNRLADDGVNEYLDEHPS